MPDNIGKHELDQPNGSDFHLCTPPMDSPIDSGAPETDSRLRTTVLPAKGVDCEDDGHTGSMLEYERWVRSTGLKHDIGVAYQNLHVHGFDSSTDYQKTIANYPLDCYTRLMRILGRSKPRRVDILTNIEGVVRNGEMIMVLGKPGSGCTTLLKTLAGRTHGFFVDTQSRMNYQGGSSSIHVQ